MQRGFWGERRLHNIRTGASLATNIFDPIDTPLAILGLAFDGPNDGLVDVLQLTYVRSLEILSRPNHLDETNGLLQYTSSI